MRSVLVLAMLAVSALPACGPIVYVNEVTRHASTAVDEARAAQADKYSPYWWTRAAQYLHQARVLAAYADFQGANRFGRRASEAAEKAKAEAEIIAKDPSKSPYEQAPAEPAKGATDAKAATTPAKDAP